MRLWVIPVVAAFGLAAGCSKSSEGGQPGTENTFTISGPTVPHSIKQDNKESVKISVKRGKDFKKDVKLKVEAPDKVKVEMVNDTVKASDPNPTDVTLNITPAKDAPTGEHTIKVTGTPTDGGTPTTYDLKVTVAANP
jgi:hypothetical protein